MRYTEYRDAIAGALRRRARGMTWDELRVQLVLPYERPCPAWTKQLEQDLGLTRVKGEGRALVWKLEPPKRPPLSIRASAR
jgi:hypothetical protein